MVMSINKLSVLLLAAPLAAHAVQPSLALARPPLPLLARPLPVPRARDLRAATTDNAEDDDIDPVSAPALALSIAKSIVGAGIFSLSARMISGPGMVPAALFGLAIGGLSMWTFYLVGRASADTGAADNKQLWSRTVGPRTAWMYDAACAIHSLGGVVQFYSTMTILVRWIAASLAAAKLLPAAEEALRSLAAEAQACEHGVYLPYISRISPVYLPYISL